jgi:hypothetical protein
VAVIGTFMAAVTGNEGGGNYGRLKRGVLLGGGNRWGSMAREKEGAATMSRRRERRRRRRSTNVVREEERPGGLRGPKCRTGRWVAGPFCPKFEGKFFSEYNFDF